MVNQGRQDIPEFLSFDAERGKLEVRDNLQQYIHYFSKHEYRMALFQKAFNIAGWKTPRGRWVIFNVLVGLYMPFEQLVISSLQGVDLYQGAKLKDSIYDNPDLDQVLQSINQINSNLPDEDKLDDTKLRKLFTDFEDKPRTRKFRSSCKEIVSDIFQNRGNDFDGLLEESINDIMSRIFSIPRMLFLWRFSGLSIGEFLVMVLSNPVFFQQYMEQDYTAFIFNETGVILQLKAEHSTIDDAITFVIELNTMLSSAGSKAEITAAARNDDENGGGDGLNDGGSDDDSDDDDNGDTDDENDDDDDNKPQFRPHVHSTNGASEAKEEEEERESTEGGDSDNDADASSTDKIRKGPKTCPGYLMSIILGSSRPNHGGFDYEYEGEDEGEGESDNKSSSSSSSSSSAPGHLFENVHGTGNGTDDDEREQHLYQEEEKDEGRR